MKEKWVPTAEQKREFARNMRDPAFKKAYEERKAARLEALKPKTQLSYSNQGVYRGNTSEYFYQRCITLITKHPMSKEQTDACYQCIFAYNMRENAKIADITLVNYLLKYWKV